MSRLRHIFDAFLIVFTLLGVCYLILGSIAFFQALLKVVFSLGVRTLSFVLIKIGFSGGILLAIRFCIKLLGDQDLIHWMQGTGIMKAPTKSKQNWKNDSFPVSTPKRRTPSPSPSRRSRIGWKRWIAPKPIRMIASMISVERSLLFWNLTARTIPENPRPFST